MTKHLKTKFLVFLVLLFVFIFPFLIVSAAPNLNYTPMETLPGFAKTADFAVFISNLYKFGIWTVGICALIMIVIGGYMYAASGGNNASMEKAKGFITDAIVGLVLALLAYLILYIINPELVKIKMGSTSTTTPITTTPTVPTLGDCTGTNGIAPANSGLCSTDAPLEPTAVRVLAACEVPAKPCTYKCNANYKISGNQCVKTTADATCRDSGKNLCQASSCNAPNCSAYSTQIASAASKISISGINTTKLITSIMGNESSCDISKTSGAGCCGLMQLSPSTANIFKSQCGVSANIDCSWLTNSANATASICIGAKYLASLASGTCGTSTRNIAARYNGGSGACGSSVSCSAGLGCDGSAVKKWECLYDDNAHTQCNTGYNETRTYAARVLACYNN